MEGGIKELAKMPMEEIEADKLSKEDIDVRLKWLGLFHCHKHQCMPLFCSSVQHIFLLSIG